MPEPEEVPLSDLKDGSETKPEPPSGTGTGRVLHLQDYEPPRPERMLREMRNYWNSIRQGRAVPARADVDPRAIARILDHAFILERIAPGAGRLRLAGRHLIDLMGMEVRGMPVCALINTSSRGRFSDVLESVFKAPQIAQLTLQAGASYARPQLSAVMLLLPLRSDLGDVTRALGCLVADGEQGVAPRRFDLVGDEVMPIIEGGQTLAPSPSTIGFAEEAPEFLLQAPKPGRRRAPPSDIQARPTPDRRPQSETTPEERRASFRLVQTPRAPEDV
ncbi:PAS domain-containing protein [Paracoccus liaowanqingii]|uniref:PAS domain-containing protein n=1 Tax=Paracoccus liaowanqingii TaxID=2560053 RepID=A0A4P7HKZ6_9RHOB|nr:PAS domain-containing protein [Paracoccus liaowanqingii]